jgi:hypothetical protein
MNDVGFPEEVLRTPAARQLGCLADYNAYAQGVAFPATTVEMLGGRRFAGGHIHIGYDNPDNIPPWVAARLCDVFIGLRLTEQDHQPHRRTLYGQAGRFRPKPYGIEYRQPSNLWLFDNYSREVCATGAFAVGRLMQQGETAVARLFGIVPWDDVQEILRTCDVSMARTLYQYVVQEGGVEE